MNHELPDVQDGFRKGRGTRDHVANIPWVIEKARQFQKNIYFYFIDYTKIFDFVDHNRLWKILKEMSLRPLLTKVHLVKAVVFPVVMCGGESLTIKKAEC